MVTGTGRQVPGSLKQGLVLQFDKQVEERILIVVVVYVCQAGTFSESTGANELNLTGESDAFQIGAFVECVSFNTGDVVR